MHFIVHSGGSGHKDPTLEMEFIRAEHRYLNDFCGKYPHRLKTCLTVTPDVDRRLRRGDQAMGPRALGRRDLPSVPARLPDRPP